VIIADIVCQIFCIVVGGRGKIGKIRKNQEKSGKIRKNQEKLARVN